jgi:phosphate transport system substrate-binding protein
MRIKLLFAALLAAIVLAACGPAAATTQAPAGETLTEEAGTGPTAAPAEVELSGDVVADGSSTVYPLSVAVAETFAAVHPRVRVSIGLSGTGGGFEKFCAGETDISNASRAIKDSEVEACTAAGIEILEFLVAYDGMTVMVNPANDFVECLDMTQVTALLRPDAENNIDNWNEVDPSFPDQPIKFYIPGTDSGTYDFMVEQIVSAGELPEELEALRQDEQTTLSEDDNALLDGIAGDEFAFGYFGFAYYVNNQDKVKAVAIKNGDGECVLPSDAAVQDGSYNPLARPLYFYVNKASLAKPQVVEFIRFYLGADGAQALMSAVGYSLPPAGTYDADLAALEEALP